jgi:hypothetical protein
MSTRASRTESDALRAIKGRLSRANRQFRSLEQSIDTYWGRNPLEVVGEFNPNFTQYVCRLFVNEPTPVEWSVRLGEATHNLRSALNHTIGQLMAHQSGNRVAQATFPIFSDPRKFQAEGPGVLRDARNLIESVQPYQATNPRATTLWYVNQVSNFDRHNHIRLLPAISQDIYTLTVDPADVHTTVTIREGLKEHQAVLATIDLTRALPDVRLSLEPTLYIASEFSWAVEPDITGVHKRAVEETTTIVERLLSLIP